MGEQFQKERIAWHGLRLVKVLRIQRAEFQGWSLKDETGSSDRGDWQGRQRPNHIVPCRPYYAVYRKGFGKQKHS